MKDAADYLRRLLREINRALRILPKTGQERFALLVVFAVLLTLNADSSRADNAIDDPIFEFAIPHKVFNSFPVRPSESLVTQCEGLTSSEQFRARHFMVFAEYETPNLYVVIIDDGQYRGIAMRRNGACHIKPATFAMAGKADQVVLSDNEMEELFFDALKRYASAFGGKKNFLAWLDANMALSQKHCKGKGSPKWMCHSGYVDMLPGQLRALERFKSGLH